MRWENERKCALVPQLMECVNTRLREIFARVQSSDEKYLFLCYVTLFHWHLGPWWTPTTGSAVYFCSVSLCIFWGVSRTDILMKVLSWVLFVSPHKSNKDEREVSLHLSSGMKTGYVKPWFPGRPSDNVRGEVWVETTHRAPALIIYKRILPDSLWTYSDSSVFTGCCSLVPEDPKEDDASLDISSASSGSLFWWTGSRRTQ